MVAPAPIGMLILGLVLFLIAPKIVGLVVKILGIALLFIGAAIYFFSGESLMGVSASSPWATLIAALPFVAGVFLIVVGQGMAKMAVRVAGILLIVSALTGLGLLNL